MCISPNQLPDGTLVGCRNCWQCSERKILDWVGRNIAESKTAVAASVVTLTYGGGDHERAAVLTYSDVQKYFKVLRRRGYPCRYFAVGEYGSTKGRTHWHIIIYWLERVFPHVNTNGELVGDFGNEEAVEFNGPWNAKFRGFTSPRKSKRPEPYRYFDPSWPHGHMVWDTSDVAAIRYACKYIQKDVGKEDRQYHLAMSKKPPLGHDYFQQLAARYVDAGLAPQNLFYEFDEARNAEGKKLRFQMSGVTALNFLRGYRHLWSLLYWEEHPPYSELLEEWEDKQVPDWRTAAMVEDALAEAEKREENQEIQQRDAFDRRHKDYYFGSEAREIWKGTD